MSDIVIRAENLGKKYMIGHQARNASSMDLRDVLTQNVRGFWHKTKDLIQGKPIISGNDLEEIWALKDVNFEIQRGESVGIIGRNGAGKSTLFKILSRITEPSAGRVTIKGRVTSLLEVGTGFHHELTGRENIYLNGAILGMTQAEIRRKFDEIVEFAEIGKFIDTPVKHYSSGMYVRLAFAVAAHLEPEILLVDEVLAVGDAAFQKKCLGKMEDVASQGRTVLFVSHNISSVTRLCQKAILLDTGVMQQMGDVYEVTAQYMRTGAGNMAERNWSDPQGAPGDDVARLKRVRVLQNNELSETVDIRFPVTIEMEYWNLRPDARLLAGIALFNDQGVLLFCSADYGDYVWSQPRSVGLYRSCCEIPGNLFAEGRILIMAEVSTSEPVYQMHAHEHDVVAFQVVDKGEPGSVRAGWGRPIPGVMLPRCSWQTETMDLVHGRLEI